MADSWLIFLEFWKYCRLDAPTPHPHISDAHFLLKLQCTFFPNYFLLLLWNILSRLWIKKFSKMFVKALIILWNLFIPSTTLYCPRIHCCKWVSPSAYQARFGMGQVRKFWSNNTSNMNALFWLGYTNAISVGTYKALNSSLFTPVPLTLAFKLCELYALTPELCAYWLKAFSFSYTVATIHAWLITVKTLQDIHIPMIYNRFIYRLATHWLLGFSSGVSIDVPCLLLIYFLEHLPLQFTTERGFLGQCLARPPLLTILFSLSFAFGIIILSTQRISLLRFILKLTFLLFSLSKSCSATFRQL